MAYPIDRKLVIAVSSSALFDLSESDSVFREEGEDAYRRYQREQIDVTLEKGVAFPFVKRLLNLNSVFKSEQPIEVVLLSKNDPETGLRVFRSIEKHNLDITRAGFLTGKSPFPYLPAFNTSLFLSANEDDVRQAIKVGYPAGTVLKTNARDDDDDSELRIAFDFDGVIVDDEAETIYKESSSISHFHEFETARSRVPHNPGPLNDFFKKISLFQKREMKMQKDDSTYKRLLRIAIITARNAPSHERFITTLLQWGVCADETFFLGGIAKKNVLDIMKPHIFFDDQRTHLDSAAGNIPSVHVPFGIANNTNNTPS